MAISPSILEGLFRLSRPRAGGYAEREYEMLAKITEIKRHLDGRVERFVCEAVEINPQRAILHHVARRDKPLRDGPLYLPAGEIHTWALFWKERPYLIYRFASSNGVLLGDRFDICEEVRIGREEISWVDLLLDLWVGPSRRKIEVLDEGEVEAYFSRGWLKESQRLLIEETKRRLLRGYREVLEEADLLIPFRASAKIEP